MSDTNPDGTPSGPPVPSAPGSYPPAPPAYSAPPPYGAAQPYGTPYGAAPAYGGYAAAKTNTLAVVSLVSSLVGFFVIPFIGSIVGIITGHMSLGQIKQTGEQGRGLALAGLIVGYVGLGFVLLGLVIFLAFLPVLFAGIGSSINT